MESPSANAGLDVLSQPQVIHHHLNKHNYIVFYDNKDSWNIIKVGLGIPSQPQVADYYPNKEIYER